MKILMVYPDYPDTFWSFKHSLRFIRKKATLPPLGLITVASLLPKHFEIKLVDLNIETLEEKDLLWADFVFVSAMITQRESAVRIIKRCKELGKKTVAGGPLFTSLHEEFPEVDHFTLNEGEVTIPMFLEDLEKGELKRVYTSEIKPDLAISPIPQWNLLNQKYYKTMSIQSSRGCPFDCEFCDIVKLNGRIPRMKSPEQITSELDALIASGWKGSVFFVDDNFIGDKNKSKELLRAIAEWRRARKSNIAFNTEVSLNLSDDDELMRLMREAGFNNVFIGLETPSEESLSECGKFQNKNRNLVEAVKTLYRNGFEVSAGFIVGFDSDDLTIFKRQIDFIQKTGVVIAMVGLLQALPGTRLHERLKKENRLIENSSGNNTDLSLNFIPKLSQDVLVEGYKSIITSIYSSKNYYARVLTFIKNYNHHVSDNFDWNSLGAFFKSMFYMGLVDSSRKYYWKLFFISLFRYPKSFTKVITMSIYYAHFKKIFGNYAY